MRVCLMIEGQEGVSWEQWVALADACERAGLEGLFRSDHYTGIHGGSGGALDAWATLTALGAVTERIRLGTLVSPVTFRHPSLLARTVATASRVSAGRIELGLGAGWYELEHRQHGFPFPSTRERLALLAEQLEILRKSWDDAPFDHDGRFYTLAAACPLPKPVGKVNVIVGGSATPGTIVPAVRFGDEYNTFFASPSEARDRRCRLDEACERAGREPLTFSLMTECVLGEGRADVIRRQERLAQLTGRDPDERVQAKVIGTVDEVVERLRAYEDAGVERVMLQHLLHDDLELVELLGVVADKLG